MNLVIKRYFKLFAAVALILLINGKVSAQDKLQEKDSAKAIVLHPDTASFPYWISMMEDPNVNYFQAVVAFETYWAKRPRPAGANNEARDIFSSETEAMKEKVSVEYVYEYKKFLNWQQRVKNIVDENGHILSPEEIISIWEQNKIK